MVKRICSIDGCTNKVLARGWCNKHYKRWQRNGSPLVGKDHFTNPDESFLANTKWVENCLVWTRSKTEKGYGLITDSGMQKRVHRWAWEQHNGRIPDGMDVDHTCWNKSCANIKHLRLATNTENVSYRESANVNSVSGIRNVYRYGDRWRVQVKKDRVPHHIGIFDSIEEAAEVAEQARQELFGEFAGRG